MNKPETKTHIEIEGVFLTEDSIDMLKFMQEGNNSGIHGQLDSLSNAICYLASEMVNMEDNELKKVALIISDLSLVRDNISSLKKP